MTTNCSGERELTEKRATLAKNLITLSENPDLPVETRNAALDKLSPEVENAAEAEKRARIEAEAAEKRALNERAVRIVVGNAEKRREEENAPEWRNLVPTHDEYRALIAEATPTQGGYTVPQKVSTAWVDRLRATSVFLEAPGINLVPFNSATFRIPAIVASSGTTVVPEGQTIPKADATFGALDLAPIKFAAIYQASSEILEDSALAIEQVVSQTMIEDMASDVDRSAFIGTGGTAGLAGIASTAANNTATNLATGKTTVSWDDVLDAYMAIVATGRKPTVVWCSPDQYKALTKSRENTGGAGTGAYLSGSVTADPAGAAWGLPILVSSNVPVRTVIVADASRIYVGVRRDLTINRSDEYGYGEDLVSWRVTSRWAGIRVSEATSVQKIVASAT